MPLSLNLFKAFEKGIKRHLIFTGSIANRKNPETGKRWLVLGGTVEHSAATGVYVSIMYNGMHLQKLYMKTAAAAAVNPLFNTESSALQSQMGFYTVEPGEEIFVAADSADIIVITVLEWE